MRNVPKADLLEAMKEFLRDLDDLRLLNPSDLEILGLRRTLREQIAAVERQSRRQVRFRETNSDYETAA